MAFGYNSPYGNPYGIDYGYQQPPTQQVYMPANNTQQRPNTFYYVNGIEGARAFYMPVNATVLLLDSDGSKFYWKKTDAQGKAEITTYTYMKEGENKPTQEYVKIEDFEEFKREIGSLMKSKTAVKENKENANK